MNTSRAIEIIIADDHELIREGFHIMFSRTPEIAIVGEASNGEELVRLTRRHRPQVVVTDIKMPKMDGIAAAKQIKIEFPEIGIVALTMFDEEDLICDMFEAGAKGYVLKNAHKSEMLNAIKSAERDEAYYCKTIQQKLEKMTGGSVNRLKQPLRIHFSEREMQIIVMICEEYTTSEIAMRLQLSTRTIEDYRTKMMDKTHCRNTAGLVRHAIKYKIFTND